MQYFPYIRGKESKKTTVWITKLCYKRIPFKSNNLEHQFGILSHTEYMIIKPKVLWQMTQFVSTQKEIYITKKNFIISGDNLKKIF